MWYTVKVCAAQASIAKPEQEKKFELKLLSFNCSHQYGFATVEGEVKNVSGAPIADLMVVSSHYASDDTFIRSDDAMVEYNPILPGQTSPFKTIGSYNPAMATCNVAFKRMFGGRVATAR
jgi:hypothetical protein